MPWKIQKRGDKFCVVKESDGKTVHCHDTREKALAQMRALYASEKKSVNMDQLINFGSSVKALGDGKVGGYLVLFTGDGDPDLMGDFFTKDTDFGVEWDDKGKADIKSILWYSHGMDPQIPAKLGLEKASMKMDEVGVWVQGQLNLRNKYEKAVYKLAQLGKLGWSSGTADHLVTREETSKGATKVLCWPLGLDASLTPTPAEARTAAVAPMKSLNLDELEPFDFEALAEDYDDITDLEVKEVAGVKAVYLGQYCEAEMTMSALRSLNDNLMYSVVSRCLRGYNYDDMGNRQQMTPEECKTMLTGAFNEFRDIALKVIESFGALDAEAQDQAAAAAKSLWPVDRPKQTFIEHSQSVLGAVSEWADRAKQIKSLREKKGQEIGSNSKELMKSILTLTEEANASLKCLCESPTPATKTDKATAEETESNVDYVSEGLRLRGEFLRMEIPLGVN